MGIGSRRSGSERQFSVAARVCGACLILLLAACAILRPLHRYSTQASAHLDGLVPSKPASASNYHNLKPDAQALLGQLPMIFEPNQGQADPSVKFVSRGQGYNLYLQQTGVVLALPSKAQGFGYVRMTLAGANSAAEISGADRLPGISNYFIGNDPKKWRTGIPQFGGVSYRSVYPGIDLVFYGSQERLEYDLKIAPGADPAQAQLQFEGARKLKLSGGDVILEADGARLRVQAPQIYQRVDNRKQAVKGGFVLRAGNRVGFEIGPYDHSRELVIDPVIPVYSTYFGGTTPVGAVTNLPFVAVNGNGLIYITGSTTATNLPIPSTVTPVQGTLKGTQNIFILELNPSVSPGSQVVYLTYLGGSATDTAAGIAVDTAGNAYVAGTTNSTNFPTVNGFQNTPVSPGNQHVFVSELTFPSTTSAALTYSTYLSGSGNDITSGVAIDTNNDVFVTGTTTSLSSSDAKSGFPSTNLPVPFQQLPSPGSTIQFFLTEVNTATIGITSMFYSTYFGGANSGGGSQVAIGGGIAVDSNDNVYFSGTTNFFNSQESVSGGGGQSTDFPILNAYQPCLDTPPPTTVVPPVTCTAPTTTPYPPDAFLAKLNPVNAKTGAAQLLFSTYFGGSQNDSSTGVAIDSSNVYITGTTNSGAGGSSGTGGFVIPTGIAPFQLCLNTPPPNPTSCPAVSSSTDAYVARFTNPTSGAVGLSYFSYLGGSANDEGLAIAVDTAEGALLTGWTQSGTIGTSSPTTGFPVTADAIQSVLNGPQNAFFARINTTTITGNSTVGNYSTYFGGNGTDRGTSITVDPSLNTYFVGDTTSTTNLEVVNPLQGTLQGAQSAFAVKLATAANLCINCVAPVVNPSSTVVGAGNPVTVTFTVLNEGPDLATNVLVSGQLAPGTVATFNPASTSSGTCSVPTGNVATCLIPALQSGATTTVVFSATPTKAGVGGITATVNAANNINVNNSEPASFTATSYNLNITPSSQTVTAGQTATYFVTVSPIGAFGNNVALSCNSLPVGASCGFNPATLTFNGVSPQSTTLSLTTTQRPPVTISSRKWRGLSYAFWVIAPGIAWIGLGKRSRGRAMGWLALATVFLFFALQPACSKAKQVQQVTGTPAGSYVLTVIATSGSFTQSIEFSLTVQ